MRHDAAVEAYRSKALLNARRDYIFDRFVGEERARLLAALDQSNSQARDLVLVSCRIGDFKLMRRVLAGCIASIEPCRCPRQFASQGIVVSTTGGILNCEWSLCRCSSVEALQIVHEMGFLGVSFSDIGLAGGVQFDVALEELSAIETAQAIGDYRDIRDRMFQSAFGRS